MSPHPSEPESTTEPDAPSYTLVSAPADGVPEVVRTPEALAATVRALAAGTGPLAVDTERAHGFRYTGRAYLIQLRRAGAGTVLLDPIAFSGDADRADLHDLADAVGDAEWIVHAATQDLPCLAEVQLLPRRLFDTELGGRLLGLPRVSLGALTEQALGMSLAKEHSASDWSRRPLPDSWLNYAALDVELLVPLRDWVAEQLDAAGKREWADQEFAHLAEHAGDEPHRRREPWRRTTGTHEVRTPRGLAVVRALWEERDELAERLDKAPGRILADRAISGLAARAEARDFTLTRDAVRSVEGFRWRQAARYEANWLAATERALALPGPELPAKRPPAEGPPHPKGWANRFPEAAERWAKMRPATMEVAEAWSVPVENLIAPDALRRLAFEPPTPATTASVDAFLTDLGVRPWQRALVVPVVTGLI
ncbi:ribonuclease D [Propioniciclava coleopterorum]|uniref:Ribonuclease D n=1 Tax=Propioniciclava coleopterorum TaxID=2714937 RepID=A0A6G7Y9W5_9ACTN|nr:HRDC domain-containing protein [Propioniciclava coleopterorum]QIK73438.1 ribonuclease D [Propioniciclava coleopterorum]